MLTALFGSLKDVFGKTFLLTGLLPAGLVLLVVDWWRSANVVAAVLMEEPPSVGDALLWSARLLGVALAFYAVHRQVLSFFESVPGLPEKLRQHFSQSQVEKRQRALRWQEERPWEITAIMGPDRGLAAEGDYVPPWVEATLNEAATRQASQRARRQVGDAARSFPSGVPRDEEIEVIVTGLRHLMELSRRQPGSSVYAAEAGEWRKLADDLPNAREIIGIAADHTFRRVLDAGAILANFPRDERWIRPTSLGNRVAALDDYAEIRYGIPTRSLWGRLWGVVDDNERAAVAEAQLMVYTLLNLCLATLIAAGIVAGDALRTTWPLLFEQDVLPNWPALLFVGGAGVAARFFYLSAVANFDAVREHVTRLVDLKHESFIEAIGFAVPGTLAEEKEFFRDLSRFLTDGSGSMETWPRQDAVPSEPAEPEPVDAKLAALPIVDVMTAADAVLADPLARKRPADLVLFDLLASMRSRKATHQLLVDDEGVATHVIPARLVDLFLAQKGRSLDDAALRKLTLADMFSESAAYAALCRNRFATLAQTASLADAAAALEEAREVLDVIVTEDGEAASPMLGWITNVDIARHLRA